MPTPIRAHRLSDTTSLLIDALREVFPHHATYEDVLAELVRFYLARQKRMARDVLVYLQEHGHPEMASMDFSRPNRYDLPPEQR